jgi:hypothetical protein
MTWGDFDFLDLLQIIYRNMLILYAFELKFSKQDQAWD